jgi:hypothetical protein
MLGPTTGGGPTAGLAIDEFAVLHVLRLRAVADRDELTELSWLCAEHVDLALDGLVGAARVREVPTDSWTPTADGLRAHAAALAVDAAAHRTLVEQTYARFTEHETDFADLYREWAALAGADPLPLLDRLTVLERGVATVIDALAVVLDRFGRYPPRLTALRNRLAAAPHTSLDAYRAAWSELHTDLLLTLGRPVVVPGRAGP